jgi:hypothetical protein
MKAPYAPTSLFHPSESCGERFADARGLPPQNMRRRFHDTQPLRDRRGILAPRATLGTRRRLAHAGVNVQTAMKLAGHRNPSTHTALRGWCRAARSSSGSAAEPSGKRLARSLPRQVANPDDHSVPGKSRTCDQRFRKALLYPAELRGRVPAGVRCRRRFCAYHSRGGLGRAEMGVLDGGRRLWPRGLRAGLGRSGGSPRSPVLERDLVGGGWRKGSPCPLLDPGDGGIGKRVIGAAMEAGGFG